MASSVQGKADPRLRLVSEEEAAVVPEDARPTDDAPTVISKTPPIVSAQGSTQDKIIDLARKSTAESIVASLRGRRLAHFELIEPIGVGGMAAVIRARDTQLDRFVALKILPPEMSQEADNVQRFHQEAKAAAKLDHENIARVFFCGEDQGLHFIAFEYVEGVNLRTMLEQRGRVPVAEAVRYVLQVATGLEHAATRGVVHRDVKPSNIIITPTGRAKLVDMGLARNLERRGQADLTQSGVTLGTFDYISPEQALEPREADMRSDIYSLGCTFYHLLTGQAPVPDGTPAKKLHHHQHLAPVDPRQIDPAIPDEIVMILGKMMAKHPQDRYQRPIHLVHHLMQVARQVGAADDVPEGVLFVDAPLPGRAHNRPLVFIGMALAALVAVTLLLSLAPERAANSGKGTGIAKGSEVADAKGTHGGKPLLAPVTPGSARRLGVVSSLADLRAVVEDQAQNINARIDASGVIELDGVVFKGNQNRRLVLESDHAESNILKFQYQNNDTPVGLLVEGGEEVIFRRVKFQVDSLTTPNQAAVAALALRGVKRVLFEQCIFAQTKVPAIPPPGVKRAPLASLLIDVGDNPDYAQPVITLNDCYFDSNKETGGQVAIAVNGPAIVNVTNTAFRPHSVLFSFRDKCTRAETRLNLQDSTGFVVTGPAFRFSAEASAHVRVSNSVFAQLSTRIPSLAQPGLIYLAGEKNPVLYEGRRNLYYALNDFVEKKAEFISKFDEFKKFLAPNDGSDVDSICIDLPDAAKNPFVLADALSEPGILAFQLRHDYARLDLGLQRTWLDTFMPKAAVPVVKIAPALPKKMIVDPDNARRLSDEFASVAEALLRARNDDVIEIKHGAEREVEVLPVPLRGVSVTLKAHVGFQPILVLAKKYRGEKDSALFKLQEGKLQFEQLGVLLDPGQGDFASQSIVHLGEAAHCVFKQCVISLRTETKIPLSAVTCLDLERMMKMETPTPPAGRVDFHECFIRGKGDLACLHGCRLLHVEMKNSLVALDGSLLDITASDKAMAMDQGVRWKMERSSVFTTDSIFALRCMTGVGLTRTEADIKGCLLASLQPDRPVVLLDMKNSELIKYLDWRGEQNLYANLDQDRVREWKDFTSETNFSKLGLPKLSDQNRQLLWDADVDWFRSADPERVQGVGLPADSEKKLQEPRAAPIHPEHWGVSMILAAGLTPSWQQVMRFGQVRAGEVNRAAEVHWCASGKVLNAGIALAALGASAHTISPSGGWSGQALRAEFAQRGLAATWIPTAAPTRICTTVLDNNTGTSTELVENAAALSAAELADFLAAYRDLARQAGAVVLTGSLPNGTPAMFYKTLLERTACPVVLDARGPELEAALACRPRVVKPNREELAATAGRALPDRASILSAMRGLIERGAGSVVVTQGKGLVWVMEEASAWELTPPEVAPVVNPIGSGDCLAAGLALGLARGDSLLDAAFLGVAAAAANVMQVLPARISMKSVAALRDRVGPATRILDGR